MNKQQKELVIKELREQFEHSSSTYLVGIKGLSVKQTQNLRSALRQQGGQLKVAKVRLIKRAVQDVSCGEAYMPFLKEQVGVVFVDQASPAVAKVLNDFSKENTALDLIAGYFESQMFDKAGVQRIAALPSREVLLGRLCGSLNAPIAKFVWTLNAYLEKLSGPVGQEEQEQVQEQQQE